MKDYELYIRYLKKELVFCDMALKNMDEIVVDRTRTAYELFYHASVLFNSLANISKIIDNHTNSSTQTRSQKLKELLDIRPKKIEILNNRQYRNSNEHYDERIDSFLANKYESSPSFQDCCVFDYLMDELGENFGRIYVSSEDTFYFTNDKIQTDKLCLKKVREAIVYLNEQVSKYKKST